MEREEAKQEMQALAKQVRTWSEEKAGRESFVMLRNELGQSTMDANMSSVNIASLLKDCADESEILREVILAVAHAIEEEEGIEEDLAEEEEE